MQSIVNLDCDFSHVIKAAGVRDDFQSEQRDYELSISCQFCWWDIEFLNENLKEEIT